MSRKNRSMHTRRYSHGVVSAIVRIIGTVRIHAASDCDTSGKGGVCGLYGSKRHTPAKGVNILRMANGKTHKVMAGCDMPR